MPEATVDAKSARRLSAAWTTNTGRAGLLTDSISQPYSVLFEEGSEDNDPYSDEEGRTAFSEGMAMASRLMLLARVPRFDKRAFLLQLFVHWFYPFSMSWYLPLYGRTAGVNQTLLLHATDAQQRAQVWQEVEFGMLLWVCNGACIWMYVAGKLTVAFIWPSVLMINLFAVLRFTVIACKYAYMAPEERDELLTLDYETSVKMNRAQQVFNTFFTLSPNFIAAEVERLRVRRRA
jgi:hypothetical protein